MEPFLLFNAMRFSLPGKNIVFFGFDRLKTEGDEQMMLAVSLS
jgi:hypothetical protein